MRQVGHFAIAALLAGLAFVGAGGLHGTKMAVRAEEAAEARDTAIALVNSGGVRDWRADGDSKLYIQDSSGKWYLATLATAAPDLPFATRIGFETRGADRLDMSGAIVISGTNYPLASLVESGPPPPRQRR